MVQPVQTGEALRAEIESTAVPEPGVACWWLGQSGFVFKAREGIVYIDPYLSDSLGKKYAGTAKPHERMMPAPLTGGVVRHANVVLCTHKHSDHLDPETLPALLQASPRAVCVLPRPHLEHVAAWGVDRDRLVPADADQMLRAGGIEILPIPSAHEQFDFIAGAGYPHLGYILRLGGLVLYHSGDCIPYAGLVDRLRARPVDVAFLPINGRDARRHALGTPGNFTIEEAMALAELADVGVTVPHHYDLFAFNTADVRMFAAWAGEAYPRRRIHVCRSGERVVFGPGGAVGSG
jgi:L-ascorbate 6-phosphate lactonase